MGTRICTEAACMGHVVYRVNAFHIYSRKALVLPEAPISWLVLKGESCCDFFQDYGCPPDIRTPTGQGKPHCFNEEPGCTELSRTGSLGPQNRQTGSAPRKAPETWDRNLPPTSLSQPGPCRSPACIPDANPICLTASATRHCSIPLWGLRVGQAPP